MRIGLYSFYVSSYLKNSSFSEDQLLNPAIVSLGNRYGPRRFITFTLSLILDVFLSKATQTQECATLKIVVQEKIGAQVFKMVHWDSKQITGVEKALLKKNLVQKPAPQMSMY